MNTPYANTETDLWNEFDNPPARGTETDIWGETNVVIGAVVLEKNTGRVPYDPQFHKPEQRQPSAKISIAPLPETGLKFEVNRNFISWDKAWTSVTKPSILANGLSSPRELNGRWTRWTYKPTGGTYTDKKTGQVKTETALCLVKVFSSEAECRADFFRETGSQSAAPAQTAAPAQPQTPAPAANGKAQLLPFLKIFVQNACRGQTDLNVIQATLAASLAVQPQLAKVFTIDSPEVTSMILECLK